MLKYLLVLVFVAVSALAQAEVFMCKKPDGSTEFSDTPCKAGNASAVVPDRDSLTRQQQEAAQQRLREQTKDATEAAQRSAERADQARRENAVAEKNAPEASDADSDDAVYGCNDGRRFDSNCADHIDHPAAVRLNDGVPDKRPVARPRPTPR
jgi:hypothetical protein